MPPILKAIGDSRQDRFIAEPIDLGTRRLNSDVLPRSADPESKY
mgnify:FL=1